MDQEKAHVSLVVIGHVDAGEFLLNASKVGISSRGSVCV